MATSESSVSQVGSVAEGWRRRRLRRQAAPLAREHPFLLQRVRLEEVDELLVGQRSALVEAERQRLPAQAAGVAFPQ